MVVDVQVGTLDPLFFLCFMVPLDTCESGFKVGCNPILYVVLLTRLNRGLKVGCDPLSFVVLFPEQLISVD